MKIIILSCLVGLVASQCHQNSFKSNAGDKMQAAFKTNRRNRVDYSRIEVEWQPAWMVEDSNCIAEDLLFLEMNHDGETVSSVSSSEGSGTFVDDGGDDGWTKVEGNMRSSGAGGKYKWTLNAVPCKDHFFRVWVDGDGGQTSFALPNPVEAVSEEVLKESNYKVLAPESMVAQVLSEGEVQIHFTPSECALEYEICYNKVGSESRCQKITKDDGNSFSLTEGIEVCTDYDYQIVALIGEKIVSEPANGLFTTCDFVSVEQVFKAHILLILIC